MGEYPTLVPVPTYFVTIHFVGLSEGGNILLRCHSAAALQHVLYAGQRGGRLRCPTEQRQSHPSPPPSAPQQVRRAARGLIAATGDDGAPVPAQHLPRPHAPPPHPPRRGGHKAAEVYGLTAACLVSQVPVPTAHIAARFSICCISNSVVDPNTLNLDPDPEFWSNLDPDPVLCYLD